MTIEYIDHVAERPNFVNIELAQLKTALKVMTEKAMELQKENDELRNRRIE